MKKGMSSQSIADRIIKVAKERRKTWRSIVKHSGIPPWSLKLPESPYDGCDETN
jgi:hypothetical protein